ncbi:hypothetical protein GCM10022206_74560 [Streptomyces chiangmaiensis]
MLKVTGEVGCRRSGSPRPDAGDPRQRGDEAGGVQALPLAVVLPVVGGRCLQRRAVELRADAVECVVSQSEDLFVRGREGERAERGVDSGTEGAAPGAVELAGLVGPHDLAQDGGSDRVPQPRVRQPL